MTRSTKLKLLGAGVAVFAVAGGGAAIAATKALSPHEEAQAVIDDAASQLGVEPSELTDALRKALENRIDEALADGRITKEQADELKKRIESSDVPLPFGFYGFRGFPGDLGHLAPFGYLAPFEKLSAAASYLGLSESELASQLADGKTLAEIAKAQGKSVDGLVAALAKEANEKIDAAVDAGKLTESQAKDLKADLKDRLTNLVNGEMGFRFRGPGCSFGFGFHFARPDLAPGFPRLDPDRWHSRSASA